MKKSLFFLFFALFISPDSFAKLQATSFPATYADLSFTERMANATEGYLPFMNKRAYVELNIVPGEEIFTDRMIAKTEAEQNRDRNTLSKEDYCKKYPSDTIRCPGARPDDSYIPYSPHQSDYNGPTIGGSAVIQNNSVIGGSCYPADQDRHFPNKIYTSGRYEKTSPAFEKAMITVFRKEGSCGTIKNDPCGYTCYGIGSSDKCAGIVVNTREEAEDFYYSRFWTKYNIGVLPDVISGDIFLAAMASGPQTAINQFRSFLGLPQKKNAKIDDAMISAVKSYKGDIHNRWLDKRDAFLQEVAARRYDGSVSAGYKNAIELKRKNGCHVIPEHPLKR